MNTTAPFERGNSGFRLTQALSGRFTDWAENLSTGSAMVLAISRKGPRLLELLVNEGFLPYPFMERIITEHALPFVPEYSSDLIITDDLVIHGYL